MEEDYKKILRDTLNKTLARKKMLDTTLQQAKTLLEHTRLRFQHVEEKSDDFNRLLGIKRTHEESLQNLMATKAIMDFEYSRAREAIIRYGLKDDSEFANYLKQL